MVVAEDPTRQLEGSSQILPRRIEVASIHRRRRPVVVERNEAFLIRRVLGENQIEGPAVEGHGAVDLTEIAEQPSEVAQGVDEAIPTGVAERFVSGDGVFVDRDGSIRVAELLVHPSQLVQGIGDLDITVIEVLASQIERVLDLAVASRRRVRGSCRPCRGCASGAPGSGARPRARRGPDRRPRP